MPSPGLPVGSHGVIQQAPGRIEMTYVGVNGIPGIWSDDWQIHAMPNIGQEWISFLISLIHQRCCLIL